MAKTYKMKVNNEDYEFPGNSAIFTATVGTTWTGSAAPYSQTITVSGVLSTDTPYMNLIPSDTYSEVAQQLTDFAKLYKITASADNTLTILATDPTTVALSIRVWCIR